MSRDNAADEDEVNPAKAIDWAAGLRDPALGEEESPDYEPDPAQATNPARAIDVVAGLRDPARDIDQGNNPSNPAND